MKRFVHALLLSAALVLMTGAGPAAAAPCPNEAFRIGFGAQLAGCRAYEMVSPVDKDGGNIGRVLQAKIAPSGDAATYYSAAAFAGSPSAALSTGYVSKRSATGWGTEALDPPQRNTGNSLLMSTVASTEDLSLSLSASDRAIPGVPGAIEGGSNLYIRNNLTGTTTLAYAHPGNRFATEATGLNGGLFLGATPDWSHILIRTTTPLTADTPASNYEYLYDLSAGQMHLLDFRPDGSFETEGPAVMPNAPYTFPISADGHRVFFQLGYTGEVVMRVDDERTVPLSVSEITGEPKPATFLFANRAGTQVYFSSFYPLTAGAPINSLYRYDVGSETLTNLISEGEEGNVGFRDMYGASPDGSVVYFSSIAGLAGAPKGSFENSNLYALDRGNLIYLGPVGERLAQYQTSPDGRYLSFSTFGDPTGGKTQSPNCGFLENYGNAVGDCLDTYVYDSASGQLRCVGCAVPDRGHTWLGGQEAREPSIVQGTEWARAMLDDGTVFVETKSALVPRDRNAVMDVYAWRDGTPELISTGQDASPSWFGSASLDGRNVLFLTNQSLVGADTDTNIDMYDARVEGGLASQWPPGTQPPCAGEGCRSAAPTPPARLQGGSSAAVAGACGEVAARASVKRTEADRLDRQAKKLARRGAQGKGKRAKALGRKAKKLRRRAATERRTAKRIQNQAEGCGVTR
jgi:hypothetical protein